MSIPASSTSARRTSSISSLGMRFVVAGAIPLSKQTSIRPES